MVAIIQGGIHLLLLNLCHSQGDWDHSVGDQSIGDYSLGGRSVGAHSEEVFIFIVNRGMYIDGRRWDLTFEKIKIYLLFFLVGQA